MKIVFYLHHKCASSWATQIAKALTYKSGLTFSVNKFDGDICVFPLSNNQIRINAPAHSIGVHLIRDPRDVIISGYYSHRNTHEIRDWNELKEHRIALINETDIHKGLIMEMNFSKRFIDDMADWDYSQENIMEWKQEIVCNNTERFLRELLIKSSMLSENRFRTNFKQFVNKLSRKILGISVFKKGVLLDENLHPIIRDTSFRILTGDRKPGQIDNNSHYRNGKARQWQDLFNEMVMTEFNQMFPGAVQKLGY